MSHWKEQVQQCVIVIMLDRPAQLACGMMTHSTVLATHYGLILLRI